MRGVGQDGQHVPDQIAPHRGSDFVERNSGLNGVLAALRGKQDRLT